MDKAKPFCISKREVWEAYKRVKANQGAAGVDGQSIAEFEEDLKNNLYKLWNRLSSGSYFPPPVRRVDIPKGDGGQGRWAFPRWRTGSPRRWSSGTWSPRWNQHFHPDSYGYRPGKSAIEAVGQRASGAGAMTGCSISTSKASSTTSTTS